MPDSKYGQVIEDIVDINNAGIYNLFTYYFDNPTMKKISEQGVSSVYSAKLNSGLMLDNKYLIAVTNMDNTKMGDLRRLSELKWNSIQTRTLRENSNGPTFSYNPKKTKPFSEKIFLTKREANSSVYRHENLRELSVTLLNSEKMQFEYPPEGTLKAALETYRTVIVLS